MPTWVLPIFIFVTWIALIIAVLMGNALEDQRNPLPDGHRRGMSILPVFPGMPLLAWSLAHVVDIQFEPWGTYCVGALHCLMLLFAIVSITSSTSLIRQEDGTQD